MERGEWMVFGFIAYRTFRYVIAADLEQILRVGPRA